MAQNSEPAVLAVVDTDEHNTTAFDLRRDIFHISASYSTSTYAGGLLAVLLLALNRSQFQYTPVIRRMEGLQNPKWEIVSKKELRRMMMDYRDRFTPEQHRELLDRFS